MTIKRRLFWSNILMIAVPVMTALVVAIIAMFFIWLTLVSGVGMGIDDSEDFETASQALAEYAKVSGGAWDKVDALARGSGLTLVIEDAEGNVIHSYGVESEVDDDLVAASDMMGGNGTILSSDRALFSRTGHTDKGRYTVLVFGTLRGRHGYDDLKAAIAFSFILILFAVFISILLTNRFLTRFVLRRIEDPLDMLTHGVHEIRDGNLDHRIRYDRDDEFAPVCEDFNEMARRLKDSVELGIRQEESRKELIAGISHDIRSPLTSIQAYVEGLLDGVADTPEKRRRYLSTILVKTKALSRLVSQLFTFSKLELDSWKEDLGPLDLKAYLEGLLSKLSDDYASKGLDLSWDLAPARAMASSAALERIVVNILDNSLKYKEAERVRVHMGCKPVDGAVLLDLSDDGPGVDKDSLEHLFEIFYRADKARNDPAKGSGLGLAIVEGEVRRMGGCVSACNIEPHGLSIMITLKEVPLGQDTDRRG